MHDAKDDAAGVMLLKDFDFQAEEEQSNLSAWCSLLRHPEADKTFLIEEKGRPGELLPIMEDEHGTYIINSKDLRAIEHVEKLAWIHLKMKGVRSCVITLHAPVKITTKLLIMLL